MGRPITIGVVACSVLLVGISALLPSPEQRQVDAQRRKLIGLTPANAPALPSSPAVVIKWSSRSGVRPARDVTVHAYLKLGVLATRSELMSPMYAVQGKGKTVLHLDFDPKNEEQIRLATALALTTDKDNHRGDALRYEAFAHPRGKMNSAYMRTMVNQLLKGSSPPKVAKARARVLAELADGSATAFPVGTVLYEAGGRFYREPKRAPLPPAGAGGGFAVAYRNEFAEEIEALSDARVPLP